MREITALAEPTATDLQRAARLWRGDAETQFFETLTSPAWVPLLVAAGYMDVPPAPEHVEGGVRLPFWPVSRYVARVAGSAPAEVLAAIVAVPATDNGRVHADLVDAAVTMPVADGAKVVGHVVGWLARPWSSFAAGNAATLASRLAAGGEADAALTLAARLVSFTVHATPRDGPWGPDITYVTVFHGDWDYRQALADLVPALTAADGPRDRGDARCAFWAGCCDASVGCEGWRGRRPTRGCGARRSPTTPRTASATTRATC